MITDEQFEKAAAVLATAKSLDQMMTRPDEDTIELWAGAIFARAEYTLEELRGSVMNHYSGTGDRITPYAVVRGCRKIRSETIERESDEQRDRRAFETDRRLGLDTSWYQPDREIEGRDWKGLAGGFGEMPE